MCWAPDELEGDTKKRIQELGIINPGVLSYLLLDKAGVEESVVDEARPEDELSPPERAFQPAEVRTLLMQEASEQLGDMGEFLVPFPSSIWRDGAFHVMMLPAEEIPTEVPAASRELTASRESRKPEETTSWHGSPSA